MNAYQELVELLRKAHEERVQRGACTCEEDE